MAFGVIGAVVEAMMYGPEGMDYKAMSIAGVSPVDQSIMLPERTFQYWPESISDTIDIGWNFKDIPGASHALAQWASNNGRTISFEIQLHRFMKPVDSRNEFEEVLDPFDANAPDSEYLKDNRPYNVDIASEVRYLRAFCYPSYQDVEGYMTAFPPPIAILYVPGHPMGDTGGTPVIYAVMTGCDVTYTLSFPDGTPRRATVALTFRQVVQDPINNEIFTVGLGPGFDYETDLASPEGIAEGGARPKNGLDGWKGGPT